MLLRLRNWTERFRDSLFYLPTLFVVGAAVLAQVMLEVDQRLDVESALVRFTVDSARSVLSTVAGATITVTGVVFALTAVSVQLASSQFSPRVVRSLLRDRAQQLAVGFMVGTFTYALLVLRAVRIVDEDAGQRTVPSLATALAVVLAVAAVIVILGYVNRTTHALQSSELIRRVTDETCALIHQRHPEAGDGDTAAPPDDGPGGPGVVVRAESTGWVQQVSASSLLEVGDDGCVVRVDVRVGGFVHAGQPIAMVWCQDPDGIERRVQDAFAVGRQRTMQQDVAFGIRQLVDIALRALSPGVNDATTAYEVIVHLRAILYELLLRDLPPAAVVDDRGRWVLRPHEYGYDQLVDRAFDQIRVMVSGMPSMAVAMLQSISLLVAHTEAIGRPERAQPLRRQARLLLTAVEAEQGLVEEDVARVREAARSGALAAG